MIKKIEISGFKIFPSDPFFTIDELPEGFILVGGMNMRGKTSIYQSLAFAFGANKGIFYRRRIRKLVNYDPTISHCCVRITLRNNKNNGFRMFPGIEDEEVIIERVMGKKDSSNDYIKINNINHTPAELRQLLKQVHIEGDNPFQFIGQEQLGKIILKKPEERLKLIDIFIPATKTGKDFTVGLRKIKRANRTKQELKAKENQYRKEELDACELRKEFEKKIILEVQVDETGLLITYLKKEELSQEKESLKSEIDKLKKITQEYLVKCGKKSEKLDKSQNEYKTEKDSVDRLQNKKDTIENEKNELLQQIEKIKDKISRIKALKDELVGMIRLNIPTVRTKLKCAQSDIDQSEEKLKEIVNCINEKKEELKRLEEKEQAPQIVRKALLQASKLNIRACYTFDNVEWNIKDMKERIRLEQIFNPIQNSICVSTMEDAICLLDNEIDSIPIIVAHFSGEPFSKLLIGGDLADFRSTMLNKIQNEWSQFKKNISKVYIRQILETGYVLNLVTAEKRECKPFIGKEGIHKRKEELKNDLMSLNEDFLFKQKEFTVKKTKLDSIFEEYRIALKFKELQELEEQYGPKQIIFNEKMVKLKKIEENEKNIIDKIIDSEGNLKVHKKEIEFILNEITEIEKRIKDKENEFPVLKKNLTISEKKLSNFFKENSQKIRKGELIAKTRREIGTIQGLHSDINRWEDELRQIGSVPYDAINRHDYAKKRLEKFKHKIEQQESVDINPEKVKEDIQLYERSLKGFIKEINRHFNSVMEDFDGQAKLELIDLGFDEEDLDYKPGLNIKVKFKDKQEVIVEEHSNLSGGEKTRIIMSLILALIRNQEERHRLPFLVLDEFDIQLDEPGHKKVMNLLQREIGAKQILVFSPNRLKDKALFADMIIAFTNESDSKPEINILAVKGRKPKNAVS